MPLCVRFVVGDFNIREDLLEICSLPRVTGLHMHQICLANRIKDLLGRLGLDISDCRGQGYDGASNMSADRSGVQTLIRQDASKAVYICTAMATASTWYSPTPVLYPLIVHHALDKIKSAVYFFSCSPKRESLLVEVATKGGHPMAWGSGSHSSMYVVRDGLLAMMHTATSTVPLPSLSKHWKSSPMAYTQRICTVLMSRQDGRENTGQKPVRFCLGSRNLSSSSPSSLCTSFCHTWQASLSNYRAPPSTSSRHSTL